MTLNSKRAKSTPEATPAVINQVIEAGGSSPEKADIKDIKNDNIAANNDVRFTVTMPHDLATTIDRLRKPSKTSRQAWLMQAAIEKLKRDGEL